MEVTGRTAGRLPDGLLNAGIVYRPTDRSDPTLLRETIAGGADLLVDCPPAPNDPFFPSFLDYEAENRYLAGQP